MLSSEVSNTNAASAVSTVVAGIVARTCQANESCQLPMPIISYGRNYYELSSHIWDAQTGMGSNGNPTPSVLNRRYPVPIKESGWYNKSGTQNICPKIKKGLGDCDEYPFISSIQGGPINYNLGMVSLRMINSRCNQLGGCFLGQMFLKDGTNHGSPFLVAPFPIAKSSFYVTRKGYFKEF